MPPVSSLSCTPYWMYVVATWDGGPGLGEAAGSTRIVWLDAGQPVTLTIPLTPPSAGFDQAHTLFVTVNPRQVPAESNGANNSRSAVIGGLPAPADVAATAQTGRQTVFLRWTPLTDPRIVGYRVYRATGKGPGVPVGSTFIGGWVDLNAELGHTYSYAVTSYTANGLESPPGAAFTVILEPLRTFLPLASKR